MPLTFHCLDLLWYCCCRIKTYQSPPSQSMIALAIEVLRLFITFLQQVLVLLESRQQVAALAESLTSASLTPSTTTRGRTPSPGPSESTIPTSPSAWRHSRTPNNLLRLEYTRTGVCPHYCHETRNPRLATCPVCQTTPQGHTVLVKFCHRRE